MRLGEKLFSFAVIADTHVNQEEGKASSDFAVNRLSNARNRHVMHALNRAKPKFVLHLGDIVHPNPGHPAYGVAAAAFHELASVLECPLYLTPGNHDVGDKPGDWLPVASVNEAYLALYQQHFGKNYFSFDSGDCHFVIIDAQIVNSGLPCEAIQKQWLEADLAANEGRRIFLCTHYPAFLFDPAENGHYDNIDEPGRSWLLGLFAHYRIEAVFAGHVHNFWYHLLEETQFYLLPSTAFVRLDYSEMYRVGPGPERGRNDAPKLGFLIVDVYERGHVAHPVRTNGACLGPGEVLPAVEYLPPVHSRSIECSPLGIDLRYDWAEITEVAGSGALDEFARKTARNDYPLMALWEMGICRLRVPIGDLSNSRTRERMRVLKQSGNEFTVYTHNVPSAAVCELLVEHAELVDAWEIIAPLAGIGALAARVAALRQKHPFRTQLSKLRRPQDALHHGDRARHVIEHGFYSAEYDEIAALLGSDEAMRAAFDGVQFRISRGRTAWSEVGEIDRIAVKLGVRGHAYARVATDNPAEAEDEDLANANRVAETMFAAHVLPDVGVWLDTFADVDRGYFPRTGLVDRRYNPRMAGRVCRNLNSALSAGFAGSLAREEFALAGGTGRVLAATSAITCWSLILPEDASELKAIATVRRSNSSSARARWIDLDSGAVTPVSLQSAGSESPGYLLEDAMTCAGPVLLVVDASHG